MNKKIGSFGILLDKTKLKFWKIYHKRFTHLWSEIINSNLGKNFEFEIDLNKKLYKPLENVGVIYLDDNSFLYDPFWPKFGPLHEDKYIHMGYYFVNSYFSVSKKYFSILRPQFHKLEEEEIREDSEPKLDFELGNDQGIVYQQPELYHDPESAYWYLSAGGLEDDFFLMANKALSKKEYVSNRANSLNEVHFGVPYPIPNKPSDDIDLYYQIYLKDEEEENYSFPLSPIQYENYFMEEEY